MSRLNVVDSSGWLEYFADTPRASLFAPAIEDVENLLVPTICLYEVFKKVLRERGEGAALQIASMLYSGEIVVLNGSLAIEAAHLAMPLADSIIYATSVHFQATLWTQDSHFEALPSVRFFAK